MAMPNSQAPRPLTEAELAEGQDFIAVHFGSEPVVQAQDQDQAQAQAVPFAEEEWTTPRPEPDSDAALPHPYDYSILDAMPPEQVGSVDGEAADPADLPNEDGRYGVAYIEGNEHAISVMIMRKLSSMLYVYCDLLSRIIKVTQDSQTIIQIMDKNDILYLLTRYIDLYVVSTKSNSKSGKESSYVKSIKINSILCNQVLKAYDEWQNCNIKPLKGIVNMPTLRQDLSIITKPGYDKATCLYADFNPQDFPSLPDRLTIYDVEKAKQEIDYVLSEFPFVNEESRSVAFCTILTAATRYYYPLAPQFLITSPEPNAGKSTIGKIASIIIIGFVVPAFIFNRNDLEMRYSLHSVLATGQQIIFMDNLPEGIQFDSDVLSAYLTNETAQSREVGTPITRNINTNALYIATGLNITPVGQMIRRTLTCKLDQGIERAEHRQYKETDICGYCMRNRGKLVMAALTLVKAHAMAGFPGAEGLRPLGSFGKWSKLIRGTAISLGMADPVKTMDTAYAEDDNAQILANLFTDWYAFIGNMEITTVELLERIDNGVKADDERAKDLNTSLYEAIISEKHENGKPKYDTKSPRSIGKFIKSKIGKVRNGLRLIKRAKDKGRAAVWMLTPVA